MKRARIIYLTTLFPNSVDQGAHPFTRQQMLALTQHARIDVIAPVAWPQALSRPARLKKHEIGELSVYHPRYLYVPKTVTGPLREQPYALSVRSTLRELTNAHDYDLILASWLYPDGWVGSKWAEKLDLPFYVKVHGTDVNRLSPGTPLTTRSLHVISRAQRVICNNDAIRSKLASLGVPQEKIVLVYNGVDAAVFHPRPRDESCAALALDSAQKYVLFVGNLKAEKGLEELLQAFARLEDKEARLVIVGSGPFEAKLNALVQRLGIGERTLLPGALPLDRVADWMSACDVLCLPSYAEGMPNVLLEGAACGTRMIATSVGGIPELAARAGDLTLVPPRSAADLQQALAGVLGEAAQATSKDARWPSWEESARNLARAMNLPPFESAPADQVDAR